MSDEEATKVLLVTEERHRTVRMYAAEHGLTLQEAVEELLVVGLKQKRGKQ